MKHFAIILGALIFMGAGCAASVSKEAQKDSAAVRTPAAVKAQTIEMTANGFNPSQITIPVGGTVRFVNNDETERWPASGFHPTHQLCPGFDSLKPMAPGESYEFTFKEAKTCPMHDHLNPSLRGSIKVE